jgi:putative transposase
MPDAPTIALYLARRDAYAAFLTAADAECNVAWHRKDGRYTDEGEAVAEVDRAYAATRAAARGTMQTPGTRVRQKAGLNRSIAAEAWGRTVTLLEYKMADRGGIVVKVPAPGTSQRCSACGVITPGSRETQARFVCKADDCGFEANADTNAACNIDHAAGLAVSGLLSPRR